MTKRMLLYPALMFLLVSATPVLAQEDMPADEMAAEEMAMAESEVKIIPSSAVEYGPIEVPGFDPGMEIAVLSGNPEAEGPYVLRLAFPDGYRFPPHWHPQAENVTVLEGTFLLAMGDEVVESELDEYEAGDYLYIPAEHPHFGGAIGRTEIQLHGIGPFAINVVE